MSQCADVQILAEYIWEFYWQWVDKRETEENITKSEIEIMRYILTNAGVELNQLGTPLSKTTKPVRLVTPYCM